MERPPKNNRAWSHPRAQCQVARPVWPVCYRYCPLLNPDRIVCACILLIISCSGLAGDLRLDNGAVLPGELCSISATTSS